MICIVNPEEGKIAPETLLMSDRTFLGMGAHSSVYKIDEDTAVKVTRHERDEIPDSMTLREVVFLWMIESPYIIPLVEVIAEEEETSLVLPLAATSLAEVIHTNSYNPRKVIVQLLLAIRDIHAYNILHLDIKPENILLREIYPWTKDVDSNHSYGDIWLADMGLSEEYSPHHPIYSPRYYTAYYRPPELLIEKEGKQDISPSSDIWALGVTIGEILLSQRKKTRSYLLGEKSGKHVYRDIQRDMVDPISSLVEKGLSPEEAAFLSRILKINPEERPSLQEILQDPFLTLHEIPPLPSPERSSEYPPNKWKVMKNRRILLKWLFNVRACYDLCYRGFSLCIYLIDTIAAKGMILTNRDIQLYACACLSIVTSFFEEKFTVKDASIVSANTYSHYEIVAVCRNVFQKIGYDLYPLTSMDIIAQYGRMDLLEKWKEVVMTEDYFQDQRTVAGKLLSN